MEYRINRKTGDKISVLGMGTSYISEASEKYAVEALLLAHENGINYADLATVGHCRVLCIVGKCRKQT